MAVKHFDVCQMKKNVEGNQNLGPFFHLTVALVI